MRAQVQSTEAPSLGKPSRERHVQEVLSVIALENQDTPAVFRALLHDPPQVCGRVENRAPNAVGADGVSVLPASGVTYDQVPPVGVQPSPAYDVIRMRRHASRAYGRLVRLRQHTTSVWLLRQQSPRSPEAE